MKKLLIFLFVSSLTFAQNKIEPIIACDLVTDFERAKEFTLKYLTAMPEKDYAFKPTPEILSFREEALHLGLVNYRYAAMIAGGYDAADQKEIYNRPNLQKKEDVVAWVAKSYDVMLNQIKSEEDLDELTYYYQWNCTKRCLARKGFEHQSHHRGKFAIYLRLVGSTPPPEQLIFKDGERVPKDISLEDWQATKEYKNYTPFVDIKD